MKHTVYLSLGSNMGNKKEFIAKATAALNQKVGNVTTVSKYYETSAWGNTDQADFLNIALCLKTTLSPQVVLDQILDIEKTLGRERAEKWAQRTIDIDILLFDDLIVNTETLTIPASAPTCQKFCAYSIDGNCARNRASNLERAY